MRVPALERDRDPQVLQRARERSRRTTSSCSARRRGCAASSSAPASTRSASRRPAAPAGRWPSGSSRASRRATWSASTYAGSRRSPATTTGCARGSRRCSGSTTRCRGRNRELGHRPRPARVSPLHDAAGRARARRSAPGWAGSGRNVFDPARRAELPTTWGKPSWLPASAAEQRAMPRRRSRSSTRRRSPSTSSRGPGALEPRCSGSARPTSTCRSDALRLHAVPQRARHLRGRPDRHPDRRGRRSCWSAARPPRCATWTGSRGTRAGRRACDVEDLTDASLGARRDGPALARAARRR